MADGEARIRLVVAQALQAEGRTSEAIEVITAARDRLLERAGRMDDVAWRRSFLTNLPENALTMSLATEWNEGSERG